jgi:dTDP-4-amino-4,6-dideoxygalactose transaminase/glycosyltransferase involved in cell wall biosynthesis
MRKDSGPVLVTKTFLPPLEEFVKHLETIWDSRWVTNGGPLVKELEMKLAEQLDVKHVFFTSNGTIALQIALKALEITGEVITTPFSYVATTNSILWENCRPVFVDIDPNTYCLDPKKIEKAITKNTQAIMAVHVYGQPCAVHEIERIAKKHNLKVIYDAAHAFDVTVNKKSVFQFGDISTLSFHATKLFHSGEGGAIITNDDALAKQIALYRSFGHIGDDYYSVGVNGKNSEIHAAMGLSVLPHVSHIKQLRKKIFDLYDLLLKDSGLTNLKRYKAVTYNYVYYPVVFKSETELLAVKKALEEKEIFSRRYFYPSLNKLPFLNGEICPISEYVAQRVLCLPLYHDLSLKKVREICSIILKTLEDSNRRPTLTVGIPAHNEGMNIANLLKSILRQKETSFTIKEILVVCDGCSDDTEKKVRNIMKVNKKVKVFNDGKRKGKATRLNEIYSKHSSDFLLTLDADVVLERTIEIEEVMKIMLADSTAQVVAAHQVVLKPRTFVGKILFTYHKLWDETRIHINNGDHISNLYGSASLIRGTFSKSFTFPSNITADEEYLYVMAKKADGFRYAKNTRVLYNPATTIAELRLQGTRFHTERNGLVDYFGEDVVRFHDIPMRYKIRGVSVMLLKSPLFTILSILLNLSIKLFPKEDALNQEGMWKQIQTSKVAIKI